MTGRLPRSFFQIMWDPDRYSWCGKPHHIRCNNGTGGRKTCCVWLLCVYAQATRVLITSAMSRALLAQAQIQKYIFRHLIVVLDPWRKDRFV